MSSVVGTFTVEDSFCITGRGLVLLGGLEGYVAPGYRLVFENATHWDIRSVEGVSLRNRQEKIGLFVDAPLATREELRERGIIGTTAQLVVP